MSRLPLKRELRPAGLSALLLCLYLCLAPALLLAQEEGEAVAAVPPAPPVPELGRGLGPGRRRAPLRLTQGSDSG